MNRHPALNVRGLATMFVCLSAAVLLPLSNASTEQSSATPAHTAQSSVLPAVPGAIVVRLKNDQGFPWKDLILTSATVAVAIASLIVSYWSNKRMLQQTSLSNQRILFQKAYEDEMKDIQIKLNSFYGPFRQLLGTSERLYNEFRSGQPDPANFRTLTALLRGTVFKGNNAVLLDQINQVTHQLDDLILAKSELIDEELQPILWQASTHFRMIHLAHKGLLAGEVERFEKFVYPRELNGAINAAIQRLRQRLEELRRLIAS
jgi:hypothetical protein